MTGAESAQRHRPTVAIIGAGAAGLMVADALSNDESPSRARVVIFDHMRSPARKLILAGRGGLNITHSEPLDDFLDRYGDDRSWLEPAIRAFDPDAVRAWCAQLGEPTFLGTSGRVFPQSFRATPLVRALLTRLAARGVEFRLQHRWEGWGTHDQLRCTTPNGPVEFTADAVVLALGGASWPRTGSTGSWYSLLEARGVELAPLRPANAGFVVAWSAHFAAKFAGAPLKGVAVRCGVDTSRAEAVVTSTGLEGGAIYAVGRAARAEIEQSGSARLFIDLQPDRSIDAVAERLRTRKPKESTANALRRTLGLAPVALALVHETSRRPRPDDVAGLARLIKALPVEVIASRPLDRAISTAGGVGRAALDDRFMLHAVPGTFVVGEMLDWEAPTGGYLLQATLSTAVAAASGVRQWLSERVAPEPSQAPPLSH